MKEVKVDGRQIITVDGKPIYLRGVGFCDGLDIGYDLPFDEDDVRQVAGWGANCIRLFIHYRVLEDDENPYVYREDGVRHIDRIVDWCEKYGIYCLLDMHMAPGGVNNAFFTYKGKNELWGSRENQDRFLAMWRFLANRYKDRTGVMYDVLNEPDPTPRDLDEWNKLAKRATDVIREVDTHHIIHVESLIGGRMDKLVTTGDTNTIYGRHFYLPGALTLWWAMKGGIVRGIYQIPSYPGVMPGKGGKSGSGEYWDKARMELEWKSTIDFQNKHDAPIFIGEFGTGPWRSKAHLQSSINWTQDTLEIFNKYGWHWTWFHYKDGWRGLPREYVALDWFSEKFEKPLVWLYETMTIVDRYGVKEDLLNILKKHWKTSE